MPAGQCELQTSLIIKYLIKLFLNYPSTSGAVGGEEYYELPEPSCVGGLGWGVLKRTLDMSLGGVAVHDCVELIQRQPPKAPVLKQGFYRM